MAAIIKEKDDGSLKVRLIIDFLRSRINEAVKLRERRICSSCSRWEEETTSTRSYSRSTSRTRSTRYQFI
eukprot:2994840-Heterocapsa_arctica.AAC.1